MNTIAVLLVILSATMHAARNLLTKQAFDKQAFVWWYEIVGLILFSPVFAWVLFRQGIELSPFYFVILVSGFIHFLYWLFLAKSLETGDLSRVYPIMRSSPAIVLVISIFILGEKVSLQGIFGILLVALGVYSIIMRKISISELIQPLRAIRHDRSTQFAVLTLLSVTAYTIADKMAVEHIHPVIFAFLYPWISLSLFTYYVSRVKNNGELKNEWSVNRKSILLCGVLSIFGYFLILAAFTMERVSYIVGLRQLSIVFAVIMGGQILGEKHQLIRISAALIIFSGTFLIALAE